MTPIEFTIVVTSFVTVSTIALWIATVRYVRRQSREAQRLVRNAFIATNQWVKAETFESLRQRVQDLESYRRAHSSRLNSAEDMIDLLNHGLEEQIPSDEITTTTDETVIASSRKRMADMAVAELEEYINKAADELEECMVEANHGAIDKDRDELIFIGSKPMPANRIPASELDQYEELRDGRLVRSDSIKS